MKFNLIYPKWNKLPGQTTFNLPPHGPVVFAATLPDYVNVKFTDENVETINFDEDCDLVGISMMLSTQVKRGWAMEKQKGVWKNCSTTFKKARSKKCITLWATILPLRQWDPPAAICTTKNYTTTKACKWLTCFTLREDAGLVATPVQFLISAAECFAHVQWIK